MHPFARLALAALSISIATACGSKETPSSVPDSANTDAMSDTTNDVRDAAPDTAYVPRAPRCAPGDAGVPDAQAPDVFDASDAADPDSDASDAGDASDASDSGAIATTPVQVVNSGGRVLRAPRVVPITFDGNTYRNEIEDFSASFGCTSFWRAISNEYGVLDAVSGTPIHIAEPPPDTIADRTIQKWLRTNIDAKTPGWEAPTPDTLYAIYYPGSTTVTMGPSSSCSEFIGFHENIILADGSSVAFAVMIDCTGDLDELTSVSSHEFIEAATDPDPLSKATYQLTDPDHIVYSLPGGGEVSDLCEQNGGSFIPTDYPFNVQRSWSNLASRTGHDPCVPPPTDDVYFNTIPELPDTVGTALLVETKGVRIPVGGDRTIYLQLVADGPIGSWTLSAKDAASGEPSHLSFSFDKETGKAGDRVALTIHKKSESARYGAEPFAITSNDGKHRHISYGVVGH